LTVATGDMEPKPRKKYLTTLRKTAKELNRIYNEYRAGTITDVSEFRAMVFGLRSLAEILKMSKDIEEFDARLAALEDTLR
jgi:hypothetical protein